MNFFNIYIYSSLIRIDLLNLKLAAIVKVKSMETNQKPPTSQEQSKTEDSLKVLFNHKQVLKVGKQKAILSCEYFEKILNPSFLDHKSDTLKLNFSSSPESIKKMMSYIDTIQINLSRDDVLEIFSISSYLQCKSLKNLCLQYFTKSLNMNHVESQLKLFSDDISFHEFKEIATEFKKTKRLTYSGIYIVEQNNNHFGFKMLSEGPKQVCQLTRPKLKLSDYYAPVNLNSKLYFHNLYKICEYDLIRGTWNNIKHPKKSVVSIICAYNNKLYIFMIEKSETKDFNLEILQYTPFEDKWKDIKQHTFSCENNLLLDYM